MVILNFAHPLTSEQLGQIEKQAGRAIEKIFDVPVHFEPHQSFLPQLAELLENLPLDPHSLQTTPLLINPPSLNFIAVMLLAELHGRLGYFPAIIRLRPVPDSLPPQFEVAELLNLQAIRDAARRSRQ
jgi:hypothetical protein